MIKWKDCVKTHLIRHNATTREKEIIDLLGDKVNIFDFSGPMSFGAAADLGHHARSQLEGGALAIILDFSRVPFLDVSAALAIETVARDAAQTKRKVYPCGMNESVESTLKRAGSRQAHRSKQSLCNA